MTSRSPGIPLLDASNHTTFLRSHRVVLVLYAAATASVHTSRLEDVLAAVQPLPPLAAVAVCRDPQVASATNAPDLPHLRLHRPQEPGPITEEPFRGPLTPDELFDFMTRLTRPQPRLLRTAADLEAAVERTDLVAVRFSAALETALVKANAADDDATIVSRAVEASSAIGAYVALVTQPELSQMMDLVIAPAGLLSGFGVNGGGGGGGEALVLHRQDEQLFRDEVSTAASSTWRGRTLSTGRRSRSTANWALGDTALVHRRAIARGGGAHLPFRSPTHKARSLTTLPYPCVGLLHRGAAKRRHGGAENGLQRRLGRADGDARVDAGGASRQ